MENKQIAWKGAELQNPNLTVDGSVRKHLIAR